MNFATLALYQSSTVLSLQIGNKATVCHALQTGDSAGEILVTITHHWYTVNIVGQTHNALPVEAGLNTPSVWLAGGAALVVSPRTQRQVRWGFHVQTGHWRSAGCPGRFPRWPSGSLQRASWKNTSDWCVMFHLALFPKKASHFQF